MVYNCYLHKLVPLLLCSSFLIKRVCMCLLLFMLLVLSLYGGIVMFSLSNMEDGSSHSHQLSQLTKSLHPEGFSALLSFAFPKRRRRSLCRRLPCLYRVPLLPMSPDPLGTFPQHCLAPAAVVEGLRWWLRFFRACMESCRKVSSASGCTVLMHAFCFKNLGLGVYALGTRVRA